MAKTNSTNSSQTPNLAYLSPGPELLNIIVSESDIVETQNGKKKRKVYQNVQYSKEQQQKIEQFKAYARKDTNIDHLPDHTILRYLYTGEFNFPECLDKLKIFLEWQTDPKIQTISDKTIEIINQGFIYTYGRDLKKRPIIYLNVTILDLKKYEISDYESAINTVVNLVIDHLFIKGKIQQYLFVINLNDQNFTSLPISTVKDLVLKLSYVYSMRMGNLINMNCNRMMKWAYNGIAPFLAESTKERVHIISTSQVKSGKMKDFIDINEMEQVYGGFRENLVRKWPPSVPGKSNEQARDKEIEEYSFSEQGSQYHSFVNNEELFEYYGEHKQTQQQCCCRQSQCNIF